MDFREDEFDVFEKGDFMETIRNVEINQLHDFKNHPFKVEVNTELCELMKSIEKEGVLVPLLVRTNPYGDGYEIISGHRRKEAAVWAGETKVPVVIRELDDDQAVVAMVDSNLHRENLKPSEKAFAYKMKLEAMKRQGKRSDLTCAQVEHKLDGKKSRQILAEEVGESHAQIQRYICLTHLIPELLQRVDEGTMAMTPAVELSYIPEDLQREVFDVMEQEDCSPSHAQTKKMRKLLESGNLSQDSILSVMQEEKPNQKEKITLHADKVSKYIPKSVPIGGREEYILKALEYYAKARERQQEKARREEAR